MMLAEARLVQSSSLPRQPVLESRRSDDPGDHAVIPLSRAPSSTEVGGQTWRSPRALRFGRFRFVPHSRELTADGHPVLIGNRALELLFVLIEARGELVTKDVLLSRVWPTTIVEENNLQFQISSLRKAFGKDRDLVRTVSGRGYRFVAEIEPEMPGVRLETEKRGISQSGSVGGDPRPTYGSSNLPAPASDIVGRESHLSDVTALVAANRLVTLVGAGGIGKTRLAIELAHRLELRFDSVWVAELGSVSDPEMVQSAVAAALGLGAGPISPAAFSAFLGSRRLLLVLDNCEHVIDAAAGLAESLLHANASLQVIATSREPLRAEGEWVYRVPSLDVPPEGEDDLEAVLQHSAARLFLERTRAAEPDILLGAGVAAATTKICRRLDGIPLAIELAAARAAALGVEGLAARVDDRLGLLTEGRRTAPARHQTLRATLDWSYELLTESERVVMRRLSAFGGDFTADTASRSVAFGDVGSAQVVQSLTSLVAKSLVAADVADGTPRYRLLETMRAYAAEKLAESGELGTILQRWDRDGAAPVRVANRP